MIEAFKESPKKKVPKGLSYDLCSGIGDVVENIKNSISDQELIAKIERRKHLLVSYIRSMTTGSVQSARVRSLLKNLNKAWEEGKEDIGNRVLVIIEEAVGDFTNEDDTVYCSYTDS